MSNTLATFFVVFVILAFVSLLVIVFVYPKIPLKTLFSYFSSSPSPSLPSPSPSTKQISTTPRPQQQTPSSTPTQTPTPDECLVSDWSRWSVCDEQCGEGTEKRQRLILQKNEATCPPVFETRKCQMNPCEIPEQDQPCVVSEWSEWSPCDAKNCWEEGKQTRTRTVTTFGKVCPTLTDEKPCQKICPTQAPQLSLRCLLSPEELIENCSDPIALCGGQKVIARSIVRPPSGGFTCPPLKRSIPCATCPPYGVGDWKWNDCQYHEDGKSYMEGNRRIVSVPAFGNATPPPLKTIRYPCNGPKLIKVEAGNKKLYMKWIPSTDPEVVIDYYMIDITDLSQYQLITKRVNSSQLELTVEDLTPLHTYSVSVYSGNSTGWKSVHSNVMSDMVYTVPNVPSNLGYFYDQYYTNNDYGPDCPKTVGVSFKPVPLTETGGRPIIDYNIMISSTDNPNAFGIGTFTLSKNEFVYITEFSYETTYKIKVSTRNIAGSSEWSPEISFTTRSIPPMIDISGTYEITQKTTYQPYLTEKFKMVINNGEKETLTLFHRQIEIQKYTATIYYERFLDLVSYCGPEPAEKIRSGCGNQCPSGYYETDYDWCESVYKNRYCSLENNKRSNYAICKKRYGGDPYSNKYDDQWKQQFAKKVDLVFQCSVKSLTYNNTIFEFIPNTPFSNYKMELVGTNESLSPGIWPFAQVNFRIEGNKINSSIYLSTPNAPKKWIPWHVTLINSTPKESNWITPRIIK
jgi:hypothetical protein